MLVIRLTRPDYGSSPSICACNREGEVVTIRSERHLAPACLCFGDARYGIGLKARPRQCSGTRRPQDARLIMRAGCPEPSQPSAGRPDAVFIFGYAVNNDTVAFAQAVEGKKSPDGPAVAKDQLVPGDIGADRLGEPFKMKC
jgi:hypothetical protein